MFYQRPRRPWEDARGDYVPGVGLGHRGHVTAQPERDGARRAGTKVSVTRVPVAGESHVWLCQNSAVSVPVAETWVHMDSGPAAGTHGCVVTAPTTPCAHQVLSLSLPWLLRAAVCRRVKRGGAQHFRFADSPLSPSRCPCAGDGHGLGPESSRLPCPCQRFPWSDCTLPAIPS